MASGCGVGGSSGGPRSVIKQRECATLIHGGLRISKESVQVERVRALNHWYSGSTLLSQCYKIVQVFKMRVEHVLLLESCQQQSRNSVSNKYFFIV